MKPGRLTAVLLPALLALGSAGVSTAVAPAAAGPSCVLAGTGMVDNIWRNGDGSWSDPSHWSRGVVPGTTRADDYVCIRAGVDVTLDAGTRVDLTAFELGRDASLTMKPGSGLFVWGDQSTQASVTRLGSTVDARGATLGGSGLIHARGDVALSSRPGGSARLGTDTGSGAAGPGGRLVVGDDGNLDLSGSSDVYLSGGYTIEVHGRVRLLDDAGLVAGHGTALELLPHLDGGAGAGRFVIKNNRGYFEQPAEDGLPLSRFVNEGRLIKRASRGNSVVTADYTGDGEVRINTGYLVLPGDTDSPAFVATQSSVGAGTCTGRQCGSDTTRTNPQFASLTVPTSDPNGAMVDVDVPAPAGARALAAVGVPIEVDTSGLEVTAENPAVLKLRYDKSLFGAGDPSADPAVLKVARAEDAADPYVVLPDCLGMVVPAGAAACVDRGASRREDGDVIMVVRTTATSRWIVR